MGKKLITPDIGSYGFRHDPEYFGRRPASIFRREGAEEMKKIKKTKKSLQTPASLRLIAPSSAEGAGDGPRSRT
jgi:hypothetical protein